MDALTKDLDLTLKYSGMSKDKHLKSIQNKFFESLKNQLSIVDDNRVCPAPTNDCKLQRTHTLSGDLPEIFTFNLNCPV